MSGIVEFGAAGKAGSRVVTEAAARGHEVTAVARDIARLGHLPDGAGELAEDVTDPDSVNALAKDADALVLTVGGPDASSPPTPWPPSPPRCAPSARPGRASCTWAAAPAC